MQLLNVLSAGAQQFCSVLITTRVFRLKSLAVKPIDSVFSFPTWGWTQLNNKRAETIAFFYFTNARTYILYTMFGLLFTIKYILPFPIRIDNVLFLFSKIDEPPDLFSKSGAPQGILDMRSEMRHRRRVCPIRSFGSRQSRWSTTSPSRHLHVVYSFALLGRASPVP